MIALVIVALAMLAMFMARQEAEIWHRERAVFFAGISSGLMIAAVLTIVSLVIRG